jgi:hypothetical protein
MSLFRIRIRDIQRIVQNGQSANSSVCFHLRCCLLSRYLNGQMDIMLLYTLPRSLSINWRKLLSTWRAIIIISTICKNSSRKLLIYNHRPLSPMESGVIRYVLGIIIAFIRSDISFKSKKVYNLRPSIIISLGDI